MKFQAILIMFCVSLAVACSPGMSPFEDRSAEVEIRHRVPSK